MKTAIGRSQHAINWMTIALLTLFVMGFGIYANSRVEARSVSCADPMEQRAQVARFPTICNELKESQWRGRIQAVLTEAACQPENGEVARLTSNQTNRIIPLETRGS